MRVLSQMTGEHTLGLRVTTWLLIMGLAGLICALCILGLTPPISRDALTHHLAVPKLYLSHGGIYEIPFMVFSYYPMNLDLLYMIPLYWGNDIVPKYIHFSFALLTAWLIFAYIVRRTDITWGLLGVVFFLSTPIIVKLSITVYVDLGLIFFSTASLLLLLKWYGSGFRMKFLILSSISCGLAMGTKYNGLITFFLLTFFIPFVYSRYAQNKKPDFFRVVGYGAIFAVIAAMVFAPWMIRNYLWTNNPIFPLYDQWFNPQYGNAKEWGGIIAYRALIHDESWWQIALLPVRIFFQGQDGSPKYFDGRLNPLLLVFPLFAFFRFKGDSRNLQIEKKILLAFVVLFFSFAFFNTNLRIRYISPIIPPLVILSVFGVRYLVGATRNSMSWFIRHIGLVAVLFLIVFCVGTNLDYIRNQYRYVSPFDYLRGRLTRDEYIANYRHEYPAMQYINTHLPSDALILFVYLGNRGYYCHRDYTFGESLLSEVFIDTKSPEEAFLRLRGRGITHLLIYHPLFEKWIRDNNSGEDSDIVRQFFKKYIKILFYKDGFSVSILNPRRPFLVMGEPGE